MNLFSPISDMVKNVILGIKKIPLSQLILNVVGYIPAILTNIQKIIDMKKDGFNKIEQWQLVNDALDEFDRLTGDEGQTLIADMPKIKEEETLDALKLVIQNLIGHKLKIDGYYLDGKQTTTGI